MPTEGFNKITKLSTYIPVSFSERQFSSKTILNSALKYTNKNSDIPVVIEGSTDSPR